MGLDTKTYWLTDRQSQCDFDFDLKLVVNPCGGGVEYLHRDPASRRRQRKGKSQIWDSKIWSDSDPRKLRWQGPAAGTNYRPVLSSERVPHKKQDRNCQTVINIWSWAPDGARHQDLLTVSHNVTLTLVKSETRVEVGSNTSVEAGLNTFTVTLRVVGGDEKGNLKSETVKYGWVPRASDPRKTALARASSM
jgi:hypothetical protein